MDFRVAPQAEFDLDDIWYFLANQSSSIEVADRVIDSITARFALASTARDDQLVFEQEILRDHRSHTTGATRLRDDDG